MQEGRRSGLSTNRPLEFTDMYMFLKEKKEHITYVHPRSRCARHYVISDEDILEAHSRRPSGRSDLCALSPGIRKRDGSAEYWASYIPVGRAIRRPLLNSTRVGFTAALRSPSLPPRFPVHLHSVERRRNRSFRPLCTSERPLPRVLHKARATSTLLERSIKASIVVLRLFPRLSVFAVENFG